MQTLLVLALLVVILAFPDYESFRTTTRAGDVLTL
jgi:hypothetical protein